MINENQGTLAEYILHVTRILQRNDPDVPVLPEDVLDELKNNQEFVEGATQRLKAVGVSQKSINKVFQSNKRDPEFIKFIQKVI